MKIGFVFPGQGAQSVGMGKDLYDTYEEVRKIYKIVKEVTGIDVIKLTFGSDEETLSQTDNTQIAILTMSLGILEILKKENIQAKIASGLSLGEYTALIYSQILSLEDGIKIVQKRGKLMQEELPEGNWSMAAILGLEDKVVEEICSQVTSGFVVPANYNCPGQVAISGEKEGVLEAIEYAKQKGAKKAIELKTSGPFHTEKLKRASEELEKQLEKIEIYPEFSVKVIKNIDGKEYKEKDNIKEILTNHVILPVRFKECILEMIKQGVDTFIEIGPGKVLSGFIKKINPEVTVWNINNLESLNCVLEKLKENQEK